jgi:hypothetical protein
MSATGRLAATPIVERAVCEGAETDGDEPAAPKGLFEAFKGCESTVLASATPPGSAEPTAEPTARDRCETCGHRTARRPR